VCLWLAVNPKVFPPPRSLDHWATRAVLGETFWANRKEVPVPARHRLAPNVLIAINTLGLPFIIWGLITHDAWIVLFGLAVHMAGKNWFIDRMALLYDDMMSGRPQGPGVVARCPICDGLTFRFRGRRRRRYGRAGRGGRGRCWRVRPDAGR